ncbi:MAG: Unknown protein [uncultured Sulfurovum sp.]|uniref:YafQ toxin protein n=1 Tax=uncultured Sulfurovum sp. TaxID=269237 RepID=A0A6S6TBH1_9BACT|nr:MAG: Unknown protein [uncultured Sulfurovum sp.]
MLEIKLDKQFKKDIKRDQKSRKYKEDDFLELKSVMDSLIEEQALDEKYLEHKLIGDWRNYLECHIKPNWLLIYKTEEALIKFARLGTHQQLFKKY